MTWNGSETNLVRWTDEIGDWLTGQPATNQLAICRQFSVEERLFKTDIEADARLAKTMRATARHRGARQAATGKALLSPEEDSA